MEIRGSVAGVFTEARVNRGSNLIQDVKLLGRSSKNGRVYASEAMDDAARLYRGAKVFFDHPTDAELRARRGARSVRDLAGRIRNARRSGGEVRGDFEVLGDERTRAFVFALAEAGDLAGFSHRASGRVSRKDGTEIVERLDSVAALELVSDPATTAGLFESLQEEIMGKPQPVTPEVVEKAAVQLFELDHRNPPRRLRRPGREREDEGDFEPVTGEVIAEAYDTLFT